MSERTAPALAKLDEFLPLVKALPPGSNTDVLVETSEALRRAVASFHMEAIRLRMYTVDRCLTQRGDADCARVFAEVRHALESAGFHTRSHASP